MFSFPTFGFWRQMNTVVLFYKIFHRSSHPDRSGRDLPEAIRVASKGCSFLQYPQIWSSLRRQGSLKVDRISKWHCKASELIQSVCFFMNQLCYFWAAIRRRADCTNRRTSKLPATIAFGHGFPVRVHKNHANFVSGFCDFSRTLVNPCYSATN